jgi:hypothetical protein
MESLAIAIMSTLSLSFSGLQHYKRNKHEDPQYPFLSLKENSVERVEGRYPSTCRIRPTVEHVPSTKKRIYYSPEELG